jgi:flavin-dependent dehydrogenase
MIAELEAVSIVGAGPSGLAAATELARNGIPVIVYEQYKQAGGRFHGDFQALENWTTEEDVLRWLERIGIRLDCPTRPTDEVTLVDPALRPSRVRGDRPLLYLVKRGSEADSLDRSLRRGAEAAGVRFQFGTRVRPEDLTGSVIVATGPRDTQAVVAGIVAETSHPDQVLAIARDSLAPKCYAYCIIWDGRATIASALARDFHAAWPCYQRARAAFATLGLSDFHHERRFGGRANVSLGRPMEDGPRLWVGEAAGLQDYFLGFGLRYALLSGHLAARSLLTGESYASLVSRSLGESFRAGFVNRLLYDHLGDRGYRRVIRWVGRAKNVRRRARSVYSLTPLHRALWPLARMLARRNGGSLTAGRP